MEIMESDYKKRMSYKEAQKKVESIKGFYTHLVVFLFINAAIFIVTTQDEGFINGLTNISNYSTIFFWGIGLFAHWASVFGSSLFFGRDWEERKTREIMDRDKRKTWE
ncbi:2TM domain-containing protein [Gramella sp. GC03-9]|uniref:2TM domain-containing protein n=1 Tax=Christiangramia oceanisediminis TaxID=2920386 RepID=A0A9X2KWK2_9FLAO|nr:2TM domain-containing protein [Gramella oceanisediminis]MCP9200055.1 2TM domain-containing protein [Gramella oceanisediminis]